MVNEFDLKGRKNEPISSGETVGLMKMEEDWQQLYCTDSVMPEFGRWTYEQVLENPKPFLDAIGTIKAIPAYQYVFHYIFYKMQMVLENEEQKQFVQYLKENNGEEELESLYQCLVSRLELMFRENGCDEKIDWHQFLLDLTENFDYEKLKKLALGLRMSLEDFEIFLCKVLKRSYINFYCEDEIFLYLVLKYAEKFGERQYFKAYEKLIKLYAEYNEDGGEYPENQKETVSTGYIQRNLQEIVENPDKSLFETKNKDLASYLGYIAVLNRQLQAGEIKRTANKRFYELWNEFKERWKSTEQMQEMLAAERESNKKAEYVKEMLVSYRPNEKVRIPAGTEFCAETITKVKGVPKEVIFKTEEETELPVIHSETVCVEVKALREKCAKWKLPEFVKEEFLGGNGIVIDSPELEKQVHEIRIGNKVRFLQNEKKANRGNLILDCEVGTYIPKGTKFYFEIDGERFDYESIEPANVQEHIIEVKPLQTAADGKQRKAKLKKYETLELTGNTEKVKGLVSAYAGKAEHMGYFADGQDKHLLTVVCRKECEIPSGTIFRYVADEKEYLYKTVEKLSTCPLAEASIKVIWENVKMFQNAITTSKKETEFLPSKTKVTSNVKKIRAALIPKRTVLSVENEAETEKEYEVSNSALLRHIYQTSKENAAEISYYKGFSSYGPEHLLNTQMFKETRIIQSVISSMPANEERLRNYILTLKFLEFVWWYDVELSDEYGFNPEEVDYVMLLDDFEQEADEEMMRCGFMSFSRTRFPYDAFLTLLLKSDDPLALFQAVWSDGNTLIKETQE